MGHTVSFVGYSDRVAWLLNPFKRLIHRFNRWFWRGVATDSERFEASYDTGKISVSRFYDSGGEEPSESLAFEAGLVGMFAYLIPPFVGVIGLMFSADMLTTFEYLAGTPGIGVGVGLMAVMMAVTLAALDLEYEVDLEEVAV